MFLMFWIIISNMLSLVPGMFSFFSARDVFTLARKWIYSSLSGAEIPYHESYQMRIHHIGDTKLAIITNGT